MVVGRDIVGIVGVVGVGAGVVVVVFGRLNSRFGK